MRKTGIIDSCKTMPRISGPVEEINSETDSDYTSYWRDWVGQACFC